MEPILFATGNSDKYRTAQTVLMSHGLEIKRCVMDIDEIQGEDPLVILKDKVTKAFDQVQKPVLVSDDSWNIVGLNGFPGPYMKSINHYFTAENFIDLTKNLSNKTVYLHQHLAFNNGHETVIFTGNTKASLLDAPKGDHKVSWMRVVSLDGDDGLSLAQVVNHDKDMLSSRKAQAKVFIDFVDWYKKAQI